MATSETNILLTSVGRRVELVRAFREAYARLGISGRVIGTDVDKFAPAMQEVDVPVIVPRFHETSFVPSLLEITSQYKVKAVFPLIDPDIPILARRCQEFQAIGARLSVVDSHAADICGDKWLTYEFFSQAGVRCPKSWLAPDVSLESAVFPLFVKPRDGSASESIFKVNSADEFRFFANYVRNPIFQEFLPGPEITSDIICDFNGAVKAVVSRKRISVRGGEVVRGVTIYDEQIDSACRKIAESLPAVGPITAQCMMKGDEPLFIEINARLGGGIPLAIASGVDVCGLLLSIVDSKPTDPVLPGAYAQGMQMSRFDQSIFQDV